MSFKRLYTIHTWNKFIINGTISLLFFKWNILVTNLSNILVFQRFTVAVEIVQQSIITKRYIANGSGISLLMTQREHSFDAYTITHVLNWWKYSCSGTWYTEWYNCQWMKTYLKESTTTAQKYNKHKFITTKQVSFSQPSPRSCM